MLWSISKSLLRTSLGLLLAAACAPAQDLPPEVLLLARIKLHMKDEVARVPNYTCLETISRFHRNPGPGWKLRPLDTVRLEVAATEGNEWYGSPGDTELSEKDPVKLAGAVMIGNGIFAIIERNLFATETAQFRYRGEELLRGRPMIKFDFHVSHLVSQWQVTIAGGAGMVGEEGAIWLDPGTLDLQRLEVRAADIPAWLPLGDLQFVVQYARTRIGESDALLAQSADLQMIHMKGAEDYDRFEFTHCRSFQVESALRFDTEPFDPEKIPEPGPRRITQPRKPDTAVPALLAVTVDLATPITEKDSVGKLIEARVVGDVMRKGKVVIESGARVQGRIRRLDLRQEDGQHVVGIEFTEILARGVPMRFYADLLKIGKQKGVQTVLHEAPDFLDRRAADITLPELPGVALFFISGKAFTLPAGFRTVWRTRGMLKGVD